MSAQGLREQRLRAELVAAGARLARLRLIRAREGNLSARLDATSFLLTPRGRDKGTLLPWELVQVPLEGPLPTEASSEGLMHQGVLREHPQVGAVVHAHPPATLQLLFRRRGPEVGCLREAEATLRWVLLPDLPAGSAALAEAVAQAVNQANAVLLPRHGAVVVAASAGEAVELLEVLELAAQLTLAGWP